MSQSQLRDQKQLDKVEGSNWVDCKKGLTQNELRLMEDTKIAASRDAAKGPSDHDAFNFKDDESAITYGRDQPDKRKAEAAIDASESIADKTIFPGEEDDATETTAGNGEGHKANPPVEEWEFDPLQGDDDEQEYQARMRAEGVAGKSANIAFDAEMEAGEGSGSPDSTTPGGGSVSTSGASMSTKAWRSKDEENQRTIASLQAQITELLARSQGSAVNNESNEVNNTTGVTPSTSAQGRTDSTDAKMGQECGAGIAPEGG